MSGHQKEIPKDLLDIVSVNDDLSETYIDKSWQRDQYLIMAVETGNKDMIDGLEELLPETGTEEHFYGNPIIEGDKLRERKNGLIIRNILCRVGAGRGGVPHVTYITFLKNIFF